MEMESSRRPFDRSREPGLKKPRLTDDSDPNPTLNRTFPSLQRPLPNNSIVSRLRAAERDSDSGGGGYQPQPVPTPPHHELVSQYRAALAELTFNSKPIITNLTIIAGENLHAAKPITATVSANIIEVPSEQKLPSLYLLDSIVKNIGRDYIKHFAAKLPEVFCKAFRQVDPPIHQSMRHLFGTWKGVFPPQTLQMIEKELGFSSGTNGSSTGPTSSRPDSQSNRPSIHVNPKYLERRLQQPSREKGLSNDISGSIVNSLEDAESTERTTSISTGRSWVESSAKVHNMQRTNRGAEGIHEKTVGAEYRDYDYGSDFSRNSGLGIERAGVRIGDQAREKPWYGDNSSIAESLSGQRNSFNAKHGFPSYTAASKSTNTNSYLQSAKSIASRSSGGVLSDSWKNSDEEEFRWGEMNSRLTDHGASDISSNFRKDRSTSVDSDKSGLEEHVHRPPSIHDYLPRVTKEVSSEQKDFSVLGHRISPPWLSQESHSIDGSFGSHSNGASGSTEAPTQQRFQALKSGPSLRQHPPSPTLTANSHLQLQNLNEQDRTKSQSYSHPGHKVSQFSGQLNSAVHNPYTRETVSNPASHARPLKSQANEVLSVSSIPGFQRRHPHAYSQQVEDPTESEPLNQIQKLLPPQIATPPTQSSYAPDHSNALAVNTSGDSSASSLLAAVVKSGILSNSSITPSSLPNVNLRNSGQPSAPKGQSSLPSGPAPTKSKNPRSKAASGQSSRVSQSASVKISRKKVGQDSVSENAPKDVKAAADPIANLLSSLVAKGLISASKTESPTPITPSVVTSTETQNKRRSVTKTSSAPLISVSTVSSTRDDISSISEPSPNKIVSLTKSNKLEVKNLIGFDFKPDVIREFNPTVIRDLLDDFEHCCNICGLHLKLQEQLTRHLEWHDTNKTELSGPIKPSRKWYATSGNWISGGLGHTSEPMELIDEHYKETGKDEPMVPADESQCLCVLCGEIFEDFYCQERDEWMFRGAKHMMVPSRGSEMGSINEESLHEGPIVHANCISESSLQDLGLAGSIKMEEEV